MEIKYPNIENSKFAEFLGILIGDGSIGIYKCKAYNKIKTQYKLQITLNSIDDKVYIQYVKDLITDLFGIIPRTFNRKGKTYDIRIFKKDIINFL